MNTIRIVADILIIYGVVGFFFIKKPTFVVPSVAVLMLLQTIEIYFLYRGQENSDIFFAHAYISFLIASLLIFSIQKRFKDIFNHLVILPLCVIPIIAGFELCVSWIMKLYIR